MAVRLYRSTDAGAPVLTNVAGTLIPVLDCLVNGLGSTPSAGWTKPFTGTNKAVYQQGAGSNARYLRVDDAGTTTARITPYEVMTTVDAGTNPFPTEAQFSSGLYAPKSSSATAAPWILLATEKTFYLIVNQGNQSDWLAAQAIGFGDFISRKSGDLFNTFVIAGSTATIASTSTFSQSSGTSSPVFPAHYIARAHTQIGGSIQFLKCTNQCYSSSGLGQAASNALTYPSPISGGIDISRIDIAEGFAIRGTLPGIWSPMHTKPFQHGDTYSPSSGEFAGKTFMAVNIYQNSQFFIEISNTW